MFKALMAFGACVGASKLVGKIFEGFVHITGFCYKNNYPKHFATDEFPVLRININVLADVVLV